MVVAVFAPAEVVLAAVVELGLPATVEPVVPVAALFELVVLVEFGVFVLGDDGFVGLAAVLLSVLEAVGLTFEPVVV
ncbi:hypothetical protein [Mycolicibacterium sp. CBMA 234]|uniref:hypothetical protein n=1 Tax=Mycolicibacterium sp. CBMA 234 TaxID=1918495 RepID=UPI0012DEC946|nr:hypothetical protein [Mycolicibacterium sp. CBMA 234]